MRQGFGDGRMSSLPWSNSRQGLDRARLGPPFLVHRPLDDVDAHCDGRCLALCDLRCRDHSHSYSYSYYYCSLCERGPHQMENLVDVQLPDDFASLDLEPITQGYGRRGIQGKSWGAEPSL